MNNQQIYNNKVIDKLYNMYKEYKKQNKKINLFIFLEKATKDEIIIIIDLKKLQKIKINETELQFKSLIRCARCSNRTNHSNPTPFLSACKKYGALCLLDKLITDKKIQIIINETQN